MFSQGQLTFAALFVVVFIGIIIFSYVKDKRMHSLFYKNSYKILLGFLFFVALLFVLKTYLKG